MKKILLLTLLLFSSLYADKVLYLSYDEVPQRVIKGEIFPLTIKLLSTEGQIEDASYFFNNSYGLERLDDEPLRVKKGKYYYDTFHFLSTKRSAKIPDMEVSLLVQENYSPSFLAGQKLNVVTLNPKKNFSNIIADSFELVEYKTTNFDDKHNILVLVAQATNCDIKAMHFKNIKKQGVESLKESYLESRITYYLVIDKRVENFSFSYFNLQKNKFKIVNIPIIVNDDSVVTQSDIKPKDQSKEQLKIKIAAGIAFVFFLFILWRRKYIYLIFMLIPTAYIIYLSLPQKEICIKSGSKLHLLPVSNGTIFETTKRKLQLTKEGKAKGFTKVKLQNNKIGWVRNEDICSL